MYWTLLQFSTEDLVKEVENSIAELKQQKQEYDEDRVREQVSTFSYVGLIFCGIMQSHNSFHISCFWNLLHRCKTYSKELKFSNGWENMQTFST